MVDAVSAVVRVVEQANGNQDAAEILLAGGKSRQRSRCRSAGEQSRRSATRRADIQVLCADLVVRGNEEIAGIDYQPVSELAVNFKTTLFGVRHLDVGFYRTA